MFRSYRHVPLIAGMMSSRLAGMPAAQAAFAHAVARRAH
jgi:hypothetical protein